ncbi:nucleoside triphosphate pyrophosphohydrolase [Tumebacillus sp. ITR2]|uniref:Nucleoside triphosphate pyrophosphohydrolase n=1 Tax=Tumebacillus amylolyticus TaxID=2801339 RepID=A0ABS1J6K6_9BACL|nr:nucleoside triphosphate pyrophosphohydrolase [Tumebacillus amylolyticus]MBL0385915.1 nucleoside triphosphate pyrophosphohydrolase [Tumebacillus amylolyticus]
MPTYNKLIRDLIPVIIEQTGRTPSGRILGEEEFQQELRIKLQEEVHEYLEDQNVEELADIMEVLFALAKVHGASEEQLLQIRQKKLEERGGFEKRIFLENVTE